MEFHNCRPEDLPAINGMIESWYGPQRKYSPTLFDWAYVARSPEPGLLLGVKDGGKIVGTQALLPVPMRAGDRTFLSAKSEETLLDVNYRGRGIFKTLYNELFERTDDRIDLIWGTTSAKKPFEKVGFDTPATVLYTVVFTGKPGPVFPLGDAAQTWKQKIKRAAFSQYSRLMRHKTAGVAKKREQGGEISEGTDFAFYADVWKKMSRQWPELLSVDRTKDWLVWRVGSNPAQNYRMLQYRNEKTQTYGGLIFSVHPDKKATYLVDLVACGDAKTAIEFMVDALVKLAIAEGSGWLIDQALDVDMLPQQLRIEAMRRYGSFTYPMKNVYLVRRAPGRIGGADSGFSVDNWYYTYLMTHGFKV